MQYATMQYTIPGSLKHERKQNDITRTVNITDQLTKELNREGYDLKRSSVYLHLLPRTFRTV